MKLAHFGGKSIIDGRMLIDGAWPTSGSGAETDVTDPATGALVGRVPDALPGDAVQAVAAAFGARGAWAAMIPSQRAIILRAWAGLVRAHRMTLARLLTTEQGKPLAEALDEADVTAEFIEWFADEGRRAYGQVIPPYAPGKRLVVMREPVGVTVAITPWNFPMSMVARKVAPALAAGCPVVLKPSEDAPFSALALAVLAQEAGLPAGVLNVVTCSRDRAADLVQALLTDPRVAKLSFTGSTAVGRILLGLCAQGVKKASMELGGNAPFIVFDDADIEAALGGFMAAKFRNAGQVCISPNRLLVQDRVHDAFVAALAGRVSALRVGPGLETGSQIGPLISRRAFDRVDSIVQDAVRDGARVVVGGGAHPRGGTYFAPTVLAGINPQMRTYREEIFGPVVPVIRFADEAEGVALANDTDAGLAAYFYTRDAARAWRVSAALESGMIGVNDGTISTPVAPFGGIKQSGVGREGGQEGLSEYLEEKYLCMGVGQA